MREGWEYSRRCADGFCWSQSTLFLSQGPFLWAEVGDILNIVFKNNASRPYSIHAHGVLEQQTGHPQEANPGRSLSPPAFLCGLTQLILFQSQTGFLKQPQMSWFCYSRVLELDSNWSFRSTTVLVIPFVCGWQSSRTCVGHSSVYSLIPLTLSVISL